MLKDKNPLCSILSFCRRVLGVLGAAKLLSLFYCSVTMYNFRKQQKQVVKMTYKILFCVGVDLKKYGCMKAVIKTHKKGYPATEGGVRERQDTTLHLLSYRFLCTNLMCICNRTRPVFLFFHSIIFPQ